MVTKCRCECGYSCGRKCGLEIMDCIKKHWRKDCEHRWDGPWVKLTDRSESASCSCCGETALEHDCAVGP